MRLVECVYKKELYLHKSRGPGADHMGLRAQLASVTL